MPDTMGKKPISVFFWRLEIVHWKRCLPHECAWGPSCRVDFRHFEPGQSLVVTLRALERCSFCIEPATLDWIFVADLWYIIYIHKKSTYIYIIYQYFCFFLWYTYIYIYLYIHAYSCFLKTHLTHFTHQSPPAGPKSSNVKRGSMLSPNDGELKEVNVRTSRLS